MLALFKDEDECLRIREALIKKEIIPRRYFHPSLESLKYVKQQSCPISKDISGRILCLPIYPGLSENDQYLVINILRDLL